jgi:hypothetical protein
MGSRKRAAEEYALLFSEILSQHIQARAVVLGSRAVFAHIHVLDDSGGVFLSPPS